MYLAQKAQFFILFLTIALCPLGLGRYSVARDSATPEQARVRAACLLRPLRQPERPWSSRMWHRPRCLSETRTAGLNLCSAAGLSCCCSMPRVCACLRLGGAQADRPVTGVPGSPGSRGRARGAEGLRRELSAWLFWCLLVQRPVLPLGEFQKS